MGKNIKRGTLEKPINLIEDLTTGEIYYLHRRKWNLSQHQMANKLGAPFYSYKMAEYDRLDSFAHKKPFQQAIKELTAHEKCVIYRRRKGWTQRQTAKKFKVSRYWFALMELGSEDCTKLLAWWEKQYGLPV